MFCGCFRIEEPVYEPYNFAQLSTESNETPIPEGQAKITADTATGDITITEGKGANPALKKAFAAYLEGAVNGLDTTIKTIKDPATVKVEQAKKQAEDQAAKLELEKKNAAFEAANKAKLAEADEKVKKIKEAADKKVALVEKQIEESQAELKALQKKADDRKK